MSDLTYQLPENPQLSDTRELILKGEAYLSENSTGVFRIDCSKVVLVTSMTLGSIVRLHNVFSKKGRELLLCNTSDSMIDSLKSSSLIHVLKLEHNSSGPELDIDSAIVKISLGIDFEIEKDIGIFSFSGSMLTPSDTELFYNMAKKIIDDGFRMLLDMNELVYIGSMGLGALMRLHKAQKEANKGEIRICSPGIILKDMLDKQSLGAVLSIYDTREEAIKDWL
ncbi:MAG: STAS domain-containing protein [Fibrobacteres bacterium]|nr:STAS domain-containing protein [Fibrobacterota bacterium]